MSELRTGLQAPSGALPNFPPEGSLDALVAKASSSPAVSAPSSQGGADKIIRSPSMQTMPSRSLAGDMPLAAVINSGGLDALVDKVIAREGSSPPGVVNNPGNIKFANLPGQIDSGIHAKDGGTFASYESPQAGRAAIASLATNAASGKSGAYGENPTVDHFMGVYGNTLHDIVPFTTAGLLSAYQTAQSEHHKLMEQDLADIQRVNEQLSKMGPDAEGRHRLLQEQLDRSRKLQDTLLEMARNPPQQKPTDLMSTFGSLAMLVAAIGGSRSRQPATASLGAAAGVIEGITANNHEEYERNFKTFQAQTGILEKALQFQNDDFRAVMENERIDELQRQREITNLFRTYDMAHGVREMEAGRIDNGYKIVDQMLRLEQETRYKNKQLEELDARIKEQNARAKFLEAGGSAGSKPQMIGVTTPDGNTEVYLASRTGPGQWRNEATGEPIDTSNAKIVPYGTSTQGMLSDEAVKLNAKQYELGDIQVITALPRGGPARIQVENQIAKDLRGMDDAARSVVMNRIRMKEADSAARTAGRVTMQTEMFAQEAVGAGQQVIETSKLFDRTNMPPVNQALAAFETNTGSPNVIRFGAAINALLNAYGKMSNPTGTGIHDADKERLTKILDTRLSQGQVEAVVQQIITEGRVISNAAEDAQKSVLARLAPGGVTASEGATGRAEAPAAANIPPAAGDYLKAHPELRDQFDAKYGGGSAAKVLGQ